MTHRFLIALALLMVSSDVFPQPRTMDMIPNNKELTERLRGHKFKGQKSTARAWYGNKGEYFAVGPDDIIKVGRVVKARKAYGNDVVDYVEFEMMNNKKLEEIDKSYGVAAYVELEELVDAENAEGDDVFKQISRENAKAQTAKTLYVGGLLIGCGMLIWLIIFLRNLVLSRVRAQLQKVGVVNGLKLLNAYPFEFRTKRYSTGSYTGTVTGNTVTLTPNVHTYASIEKGWVLKAKNVSREVIRLASVEAELHDGRGMLEQIKTMGEMNMRPGEAKNMMYTSKDGLFMKRLVISGVNVTTANGSTRGELDVRIPYFRLPVWPVALLMGILMLFQVDGSEWQSMYSFFLFAISLLAFICAGFAAMRNRTTVWLMIGVMLLTLGTHAPYLVLLGAVYIGLVAIKRLGFADTLSGSETKL